MTPRAASLPSPERAALLLDLDGTLLDIAPTPDSVVVPAALLDALRGLVVRLGGAVAVISGRPVEQVDVLLHAIPTAVAGEHGGATRFAPAAPLERVPLPSAPAEWLAAAERIEAETGVPVLDSIATVVWKSLILAGADPARVTGWGRVFGVPAIS